jgi:hypothetical protein
MEEIDDLKEEGYRKNARTKDVLKSEKDDNGNDNIFKD